MRNEPSSVNEDIILTIIIPTYNGAKTLAETLESVVHQLNPAVDILISDNASTDETAEIALQYQSQYPQIHYRRNPVNIGPDKNYEIAIRSSKGQFVWLFSDDDIFEKGAINLIVDNLCSIDPSIGLILVDCRVVNVIHNKILMDGLNPVRASYCLPARHGLLHDPAHEMPGVISTIIVKRQLLDGFDFSPLSGTFNMQVGISYYLATIAHTLVLHDKLFMFRRDDVERRWAVDSHNIDFYFGYETAASYGLGDASLIAFMVKPKLRLLPRYLGRIRRSHRMLPRLKTFRRFFAKDLQIYRHWDFWVSLPILLIFIFTPAFIFQFFSMIKNYYQRFLFHKSSSDKS